MALSALFLSPVILTFEQFFCTHASSGVDHVLVGQETIHVSAGSMHRYTKSTKRLPDTTVNVCGASTQSNTLESNLNRPHVAPSVPRPWKHPMDVCRNLRICNPG